MKNTNWVFLIFHFIYFQNCFAQDTLIYKNGLRIIAKVQEISPTQIRYKKFNNLSGPDYVEKKEAISAIKFSNGLSEMYQQKVTISKDKMERKWSDFMKWNICFGAVVNNSFCNIPRPQKEYSQTDAPYEFSRLTRRNYTNVFAGFDAQFGTSPFFKHLIEVQYLLSESDFKYKYHSFTFNSSSHYSETNDDFFECHSNVHYLNISTGFRFILFKKISIDNSLCLINPILSKNSKSGYTAVNNQYTYFTNSQSKDKFVKATFSYCPKIQLDLFVKNRKCGISLARNFSFQNYQPWWALGIVYYPLKKLS